MFFYEPIDQDNFVIASSMNPTLLEDFDVGPISGFVFNDFVYSLDNGQRIIESFALRYPAVLDLYHFIRDCGYEDDTSSSGVSVPLTLGSKTISGPLIEFAEQLANNKDFCKVSAVTNSDGYRTMLVLAILARYERRPMKEFISLYANLKADKRTEYTTVFEHCAWAMYRVFGLQTFRTDTNPHIPDVVLTAAVGASFAHYNRGAITAAADEICTLYGVMMLRTQWRLGIQSKHYTAQLCSMNVWQKQFDEIFRRAPIVLASDGSEKLGDGLATQLVVP